MTRSELERVYDATPYSQKDMAGLPTRFFMLDESMISFLEEFVEMLDISDNHDNIEDITVAKELMHEASQILDTVTCRIYKKEGLNESC